MLEGVPARWDCGLKEIDAMRITAILIIVTTTFMSHGFAGDVRHNSIPKSFFGTWAPSPQVCKDADKSVIVLSAKTYGSSMANCTVNWVNETASTHGPVYSAHMQCLNPSEPARKVVSNLIMRSGAANQISAGPDFDSLKVYQ